VSWDGIGFRWGFGEGGDSGFLEVAEFFQDGQVVLEDVGVLPSD
jgi:hypothetical protein